MTTSTKDTEAQPRAIKDLALRVEQLEISSNITINHTELLLEFVRIISEIPAGKQIFNRALNRQQLNRLRGIVLPRRQKELASFFNRGENSTMPPGIKDQFVSDEMKLIRSVIRSIQHREHYETAAAESVRTMLTRLFTKIKRAKLVTDKRPMKHRSNSSLSLKGGAHART
jgi:hypothetical protein